MCLSRRSHWLSAGFYLCPLYPLASLMQRRKLIQHLTEYLIDPKREWPKPKDDMLSPIGTYNLYLGVLKVRNKQRR